MLEVNVRLIYRVLFTTFLASLLVIAACNRLDTGARAAPEERTPADQMETQRADYVKAVEAKLAEFEMAAGWAPRTRAVGAAPKTKQDLTIAHHQHADTYKRAAALLVKTFRSAHDPPA